VALTGCDVPSLNRSKIREGGKIVDKIKQVIYGTPKVDDI
jgi:hypothetical protein